MHVLTVDNPSNLTKPDPLIVNPNHNNMQWIQHFIIVMKIYNFGMTSYLGGRLCYSWVYKGLIIISININPPLITRIAKVTNVVKVVHNIRFGVNVIWCGIRCYQLCYVKIVCWILTLYIAYITTCPILYICHTHTQTYMEYLGLFSVINT